MPRCCTGCAVRGWRARRETRRCRAVNCTRGTSGSTCLADRSLYTPGGTVQAGGGVYLSRRADDELFALCREGTFAFVLTARQMGKSSLMTRTAERLIEDGVRSVIIDLNALGTRLTVEQ